MVFMHLKFTKSVCPACFEEIESEIVCRDGKVYIEKECEEHGEFNALHLWDDIDLFNVQDSLFSNIKTGPNGVIIHLTDRCNMGCPFCFTKGNSSLHDLEDNPSLDVIIDKIKRFERSFSFSTIFLFGGEPTLRSDLPQIINTIVQMGYETCLFTNGIRLCDREYVNTLEESGLGYVVLQVDSLDREVNKKIRGKDVLQKKLRALDNIKKTSITVDLFSVVLGSKNEEELSDILEFCRSNSETINNIYLSSISYVGKASEVEEEYRQITNSERVKLVTDQTCIRRKDFIWSTAFDRAFCEFIEDLVGLEIKHLAVCDMVCYVYNSGKIESINKTVDLKNLTFLLRKSSAILKSERKSIAYIKVFTNLFNELLSGNLVNDWKKFSKILFSGLKSFFPLLNSKSVENRFERIFRVIITQFQDRYNLDFETFNNCNLYAELPNGELGSFCKRNACGTN